MLLLQSVQPIHPFNPFRPLQSVETLGTLEELQVFQWGGLPPPWVGGWLAGRKSQEITEKSGNISRNIDAQPASEAQNDVYTSVKPSSVCTLVFCRLPLGILVVIG